MPSLNDTLRPQRFMEMGRDSGKVPVSTLVKKELLDELTNKHGINRFGAARALYNTGNRRIEAALDWIEIHQFDENFDKTMEVTPPRSKMADFGMFPTGGLGGFGGPNGLGGAAGGPGGMAGMGGMGGMGGLGGLGDMGGFGGFGGFGGMGMGMGMGGGNRREENKEMKAHSDNMDKEIVKWNERMCNECLLERLPDSSSKIGEKDELEELLTNKLNGNWKEIEKNFLVKPVVSKKSRRHVFPLFIFV